MEHRLRLVKVLPRTAQRLRCNHYWSKQFNTDRLAHRLKALGESEGGLEVFDFFARKLDERRRRAALRRIDLSDRSRTPLAEQRGVAPIPLRVSDLETLRELGETELADEYLAAWERWKAQHTEKGGQR